MSWSPELKKRIKASRIRRKAERRKNGKAWRALGYTKREFLALERRGVDVKTAGRAADAG